MKIIIPCLIVTLSVVLIATTDAAEKQLAKEAKITRNQAEQIVLTKVPHGYISTGELEREHGKLIWSFDIARPATPDISEVQVDAKTGRVVSIKTETPKDQAAEVAADKKKR